MSVMKCVICHQQFQDGAQAKGVPCSGGGHILQEAISGTRNSETGDVADFHAPSSRELAEWAKKAKDLGFDID